MPQASSSVNLKQVPRPSKVSEKPRRAGAQDTWQGASTDLIDRFVDVFWVENRLSRVRLRECRAELRSLDCWMGRTLGRSLVTANASELRVYFWVRVLEGRSPQRLDVLLVTLRAFFRYLRDSGCQTEDAASGLPASFSEAGRQKRAASPLAYALS